jgi:hypothetical protein
VAGSTAIAKEKDRLTARLAEAEKLANSIRRELAEIQTAERVLERLTGHQVKGGQPNTPPKPNSKPPTIKEAALEALKSAYPKGYRNGGIRHYAKEKYGLEIKPGSLSVMLMRLRDDDHSARNSGLIWLFVPPEKRKGA